MQASGPFYLKFPRATWAAFRQDTPLTLGADDVARLRGQIDPVSVSEVEAIYLPLSRLLNLYVAASQDLHAVTSRFLGHEAPRVPYIVGVAGSVAVGKSTTSRLLRALLARWPHHPRVELITTDGYLYPNAVLERRHLMARKGFPESYDLRALLQTLADLKAGKAEVRVPIYSHHDYDVVPGEHQMVRQPDIVIVEGVNVLQVRGRHEPDQPRLFVSDFFDFSIYVDAPAEQIEAWYLERFMLFRERAKDDPKAFFHRFAAMSEAEALACATQVWRETNEVNLRRNIVPYGQRARLILQKGKDHAVTQVLLRRV